MICQACGTDNGTGRKFCDECGSPLSVPCPTCGTANRPGAKFCGECAAPLGLSAPGEPAAIDLAGPASVVKAERRLVTVLFADLVGFTTIAEGRDAEAVRELLSSYFDLTSELLARYGGTVEKFIGDAVMAVWGTPVAHEDDAERAVRAGLELVDRVRTLGPGIAARVGILTGEAAVTLGATNQGMVAGDLVNTASRLQSVAEPGMVLVGESTYGAVSAAIACEPVGEQSLKGKTAPVTAWRALRVVAERGGTGRAERLEAPFVGRDAELQTLKDLLHATGREGRPRLVSVVGQAGIGKSRLVWELLKYIDGLVESIYWHDGRSPSYGEGVTFWALGEMVRQRAGLAEADDERTLRSRVVAMLEEYVEDPADRRWIEPSLLTLLGVEPAPGGGGQELFAAWRTFFERVAAKGTVAMVFEDLHWADAGLLDFIEDLVESARAPILVVTMARPELVESRPSWGSAARSFTSIHLDPLSSDSIHELLAGLVPGLPAATADMIVERSEGVPLYAVETVRMLVAQGRLADTDGAYRPVGDLASLDVPDTLHALIAARLDALDPSDRALLQDAAVLGQSFTPAALDAVSGLDEEAIVPRLKALVRKELLTLDADPRSPERGQFAFIQALVREVAYSTLARRDRRARHLAAARYFEALGDGELAGVLAAHYVAAHRESGDGAEAEALAVQARIALRAAAQRAGQLGSHEQEVGFLESAIAIATDRDEEADLLQRAGVAASLGGRHDRAEDFLQRARTLLGDVGDRRALLEVTTRLVETRLNAFQVGPALELLVPAAEEFADLDESDLVTFWSQLSRARFFAGDAEEAIRWCDKTLGAAERLDLVPTVADALVTKGTVLAEIGRIIEGAALLRAALSVAETDGLIATAGRAYINLSYALTDADPKESMDVARAGLEFVRRYGASSLGSTLIANFSQQAIRFGLWAEALAEIRGEVERGRDPIDELTMRVYEVQLLALMGEPFDEALERCRALAKDETDRQIQAELHLGETVAALVVGRLDDAVALGHQSALELSMNATNAYRFAGRAAAWKMDLESLRLTALKMDELPIHGRNLEATRQTLRACIAALEGRRDEAASQFSLALGTWNDLGLELDAAMTGIDAALLLDPADPVARSAAEQSHVILTRLGAPTLLARLESARADKTEPTNTAVAVGR